MQKKVVLDFLQGVRPGHGVGLLANLRVTDIDKIVRTEGYSLKVVDVARHTVGDDDVGVLGIGLESGEGRRFCVSPGGIHRNA